MASDLSVRILSNSHAANGASDSSHFMKKLLTPGSFPLLRYAAEYALTVLLIALLVAFVMHLLASALIHLIIVPGWPRIGTF